MVKSYNVCKNINRPIKNGLKNLQIFLQKVMEKYAKADIYLECGIGIAGENRETIRKGNVFTRRRLDVVIWSRRRR